MELQNDKDLQRLLSIQMFLESGMNEFLEKEYKDFVGCVDEEIRGLEKQAVGLESLSRLNHNLGRKAGLEMALNVLEQLKEELRDNSLAKR